MKKLIFSILSMASLYSVNAQDSVSVLFIGNSYTYGNNLPNLVEDIANSLGDKVYHDNQTAGGSNFYNHSINPVVYSKINSEPWDFVVMQAQSQEPSFPENQVNTETLPYAMQMADSVYKNKFCTDVMMFMTWGRENGDPQWAPISTFEGMNDRLRSAYIRFADSVQGSVSAVGSAWRYVRDNHPTIDLYTSDGSHPNLAGSYLAACTFYASLFRKTPVGAPFISTLDANTAGILQNAAALTVLDSLDFWNLRPISEHTQAEFSFSVNGNTVDFENLSTKATDYSWDFGDLNSSSLENPSHTYTMDGTYTVELTSTSPCDNDVITYQVTIGSASINELNESVELLSLEGGVYEIISEEPMLNSIVTNYLGQKLDLIQEKSNSFIIDLSEQPSGLYLIRVQTTSGHSIVRVRK